MPPRWNWSYSKITVDLPEKKDQDSCEDSNVCSNETTQTRKSPWMPMHLSRTSQSLLITIVLIFVVVLGIGLPASLLIKSSSSQTTSQHHPNRCGNSTQEAISLGCSFNQLMWAWYPAQCPHYADQDFIKAENWTYYQDFHGNGKISAEHVIEAMDNGITLWTQQREHVTHCVFMFLSLGQIFRDGTAYTERMTNYAHIEHCVDIILEVVRKDRDWQKITTSVPQVDYSASC